MWALRGAGLRAIIPGYVWVPGRNEAVCSPHLLPSRRPNHSSPQPGCNCGFNAYFALGPELTAGADTVVGAIAAWGEMDVYADGFRAQFAQVIALSFPPRPEHGPGMVRLREAADDYSVPLVPLAELRDEALRHAAPLSAGMLPAAAPPAGRRRRPRTSPRPRPSVAVARWGRARGHSIWVRRHVAVRAGDGRLELAPAPGASALADPDPEVRVLPHGRRVAAGDCVATISSAYPGEVIHLLSPAAGRVSAHNVHFGDSLRHGDRAVSSAPWLVAIKPDDAPLEDAPLLWGRPGVELYRRSVVRQSDAEVLAELGPPPGFDAAALAPPATGIPGQRPALAPHQRTTTSIAPEQGRRAAIMVEHLRPLLQACGEDGTLLAA